MNAPSLLRDGVGPSTIRLPAGDWPGLLAFLVQRFPAVGAEVWRERLRLGKVIDAQGQPLDAQAPYRPGSLVHYYRELEDEPHIPFEAEILHRDEHLLVVDKPHFLPVVPSGRFLQQTLLVRLKRQLGLEDLAPLHRIDRGTAGLVMFSLRPDSRGAYQALFARREIGKCYQALAPALPQCEFPLLRRSRIVEGEPFFLSREVEGEPNSETRIELQERRGALNLYALHPVSGRKHQLRVHLAALGAPIVNDSFYPALRPELDDDYTRPLQLLAKTLAFRDPLDGAPRYFESRRRLGP